MALMVPQIDAVIPDGIRTLAAYRKWVHSDDFPTEGRFAWLNGNVWMDLTMEPGYSRNLLKTEITAVLARMCKRDRLGHYFSDGMLLSNVEAGFYTIPDGMLVTHQRLADDRVRKVVRDDGDFVELIGAPDMTLEIVSKSSLEKDTQELMEGYCKAGVDEYWLADAREKELRFDIYRAGSKGYIAVRKQADGWLRSSVFGKAIRLRRDLGREGLPEFYLDVR